MRLITFKDAIKEAQEEALSKYPECFVIGEGVGDPKNVFGTTAGLKDKFSERVFDMPISENGMTGVCIGAAINGMKPILVHQRIDFSLYSMDQIVNNAAKWYSMFGGQKSVPMVIRMIVGRGWGQGNQHSQNLTAMFAHVPGLKIVCPSNAFAAKGLFATAIKDPNPVLFIEHRWLYETTSEVNDYSYSIPFGIPVQIKEGSDITIVASGHSAKEARLAVAWLEKQEIHCDLLDLCSIKPLPISHIIDSVSKTKKILVVDDAWEFAGISAEIIASVCTSLQCSAQRLTYPNYPSASSPGLTEHYYPRASQICHKVLMMLNRLQHVPKFSETPHDVPDLTFKGPF